MNEVTSVVQISDTHFGTEQQRVTGALSDAINRIQPELLLWTGDITQRARRSQFKAANRFLRGLDYGKLICIPGNHDVPLFNLFARALAPYRNYRRFLAKSGALSKEQVECFELGRVVVIAVNSCNLWHYKNGRFAPEVVHQVENHLKRADSNRLKLVIAHHPVDALLESDEENIVAQAQAALPLWAEAGMDAIMGGHIHYQFVRELGHRYPRLTSSARVIQAGTANSSRTRSGLTNSFTRLTLAADKRETRIEIWNYSEQEGFQPSQSEYLFANKLAALGVGELTCSSKSRSG